MKRALREPVCKQMPRSDRFGTAVLVRKVATIVGRVAETVDRYAVAAGTGELEFSIAACTQMKTIKSSTNSTSEEPVRLHLDPRDCEPKAALNWRPLPKNWR